MGERASCARHRGEAAVVRVAAAAEAAPAVDGGRSTMTSAETARTIVDISSHGTLSTVGDDSIPLGTYVTYVLDQQGLPLLRLRKGAVHTANLLRDARCSLFIHPAELPARLLGRVTLIGEVEECEPEAAAAAAAAHAEAFGNAVGVDAPREDDLFYRLRAATAFFVGGMGSEACAEVISAGELLSAEPDELRKEAPGVVFDINSERPADVLRIAADALGLRFDQLEAAELLWVDSRGAFLCAYSAQAGERILRVPFPRAAGDERAARSALTMLAQVAWEKERSYKPIMPQLPLEQAS